MEQQMVSTRAKRAVQIQNYTKVNKTIDVCNCENATEMCAKIG